MSRKEHTLKPTKGNDRPRNVIFFDTETYEEFISDTKTKHRLKLGVAVYCRSRRGEYLLEQREVRISSGAEFWKDLDKRIPPKSKYYLVAHNILFDLTVLDVFTLLPALGWKMASFYSKGFTNIFRWKQADRTLIMMDNGNLFPGKLAKWGKLLGLDNGEVDFETVSDEELADYCRNDVEIMIRSWRAWLGFLDQHDCGAFKLTIGSTAFNTWRHRFLDHKVWIHSNELALTLEREAYKGGRVEALFQGNTNHSSYYYLDVNNMYGYVLEFFPYPKAIQGAQDHCSLEILRRRLERYAVIAKVKVKVTENLYAYRLNGHLCYPLGEFETTLTTPELKLAMDNGWIESVSAIVWYTQAQLFTEYVRYFYALRERYVSEDNPAYSEICKRLINHLYGKFGQHGFKQKVVGSCPIDKVFRETVYGDNSMDRYWNMYIGGVVYKEWQEGESYHSFPAIAAHVTAYARLYLDKLRRKVTPGHVFYMDTDSLIVDETGFQELYHLLHDTELGRLKVEQQSPWLTINAPKDYSMEGRKRIKGVSPKAVEVAPGVYDQTQWARLFGMMHAGDLSGYTTHKVRKVQKRQIHSGVLRSSGWIDPYHLPLPAE